MGFLSALPPPPLPLNCIYLGTQTSETPFFPRRLQCSVAGERFFNATRHAVLYPTGVLISWFFIRNNQIKLDEECIQFISFPSS